MASTTCPRVLQPLRGQCFKSLMKEAVNTLNNRLGSDGGQVVNKTVKTIADVYYLTSGTEGHEEGALLSINSSTL